MVASEQSSHEATATALSILAGYSSLGGLVNRGWRAVSSTVPRTRHQSRPAAKTASVMGIAVTHFSITGWLVSRHEHEHGGQGPSIFIGDILSQAIEGRSRAVHNIARSLSYSWPYHKRLIVIHYWIFHFKSEGSCFNFHWWRGVFTIRRECYFRMRLSVFSLGVSSICLYLMTYCHISWRLKRRYFHFSFHFNEYDITLNNHFTDAASPIETVAGDQCTGLIFDIRECKPSLWLLIFHSYNGPTFISLKQIYLINWPLIASSN